MAESVDVYQHDCHHCDNQVMIVRIIVESQDIVTHKVLPTIVYLRIVVVATTMACKAAATAPPVADTLIYQPLYLHTTPNSSFAVIRGES
jgi:hypothetical protein